MCEQEQEALKEVAALKKTLQNLKLKCATWSLQTSMNFITVQIPYMPQPISWPGNRVYKTVDQEFKMGINEEV